MAKQHRRMRYNGQTVPETIHKPDGPSAAPDGIAATLSAIGMGAETGGNVAKGAGGLGGFLSAYSMWTAGNDMAENGVDPMNTADMGAGYAGLLSTVAGMIGAPVATSTAVASAGAAPVVAATAGGLAAGYAGGKVADAGTAWVAPDNRGISDRMADRGVQAELSTDELFGEDSMAGDVVGGLTMLNEIIRPGSFTEHMANAASERAVDSISSWMAEDETEVVHEDEEPKRVGTMFGGLSEALARQEEDARNRKRSEDAVASLSATQALQEDVAKKEAHGREVAAQEEHQAQVIAAAQAAEMAKEDEPGVIGGAVDAASDWLSDLW